MSLKTRYHSVAGHVLAETVASARTDYLLDALGSVTGTVDQTGASAVSARYKPYGATLASSGTQPTLGWVGRLGYRPTGR